MKSVSRSTVSLSFRQNTHLQGLAHTNRREVSRIQISASLHNELSARSIFVLNKMKNKISRQYFSYFTEIVLVFVCFLCRNFSFYFVLVSWITIILVLVFWKRRPIILVLVLIFVTKITLVGSGAELPLKTFFQPKRVLGGTAQVQLLLGLVLLDIIHQLSPFLWAQLHLLLPGTSRLQCWLWSFAVCCFEAVRALSAPVRETPETRGFPRPV